MNTNPFFTKVRTDLLGKVNFALNRYSTIRNAVPCSQIKAISSLLLEAGVDSYKLECLKNIPEGQAICVCRLANCCDDRKVCYFCTQIAEFDHVDKDKWYAQNDTQILTVFEGNTKNHVIVQKFHVEQDDGTLQLTHQFVPTYINPCNRYKSKILCTNGENCKFNRRGQCAFLHKGDVEQLEKSKISPVKPETVVALEVKIVEPKKKLVRRKPIKPTDSLESVEPKEKSFKRKIIKVESEIKNKNLSSLLFDH